MNDAEEGKLYSRSLDVRTLLETASGDKARQLKAELAELEKGMAQFRVAKLEKQRQAFLRKGETRDALYIEQQQVEIRVRAGLQDASSGERRKREIDSEREKALSDSLEADWKKKQQARANELSATIAKTPWVANPKNAAIRPNGCSTCANSQARLQQSLADEKRNAAPMTVAASRAAIGARWPNYAKKDAKNNINVVPRAHVEGFCGVGAGACVRYGEVFLPSDASAWTVNHETLHTLAADRWSDRMRGPVDEAATEYLNRRMGYFPPAGGVQTKAYEGGQRLVSEYIAANPAREDALAKAYFKGDFSDLERLDDYRAAPGKTSFETRMADWTRQLENKLPDGSVTVDDEYLQQKAKKAPARDRAL